MLDDTQDSILAGRKAYVLDVGHRRFAGRPSVATVLAILVGKLHRISRQLEESMEKYDLNLWYRGAVERRTAVEVGQFDAHRRDLEERRAVHVLLAGVRAEVETPTVGQREVQVRRNCRGINNQRMECGDLQELGG